MKTFNGHKGGCKCDPCRLDRNAYQRARHVAQGNLPERRVGELLRVMCWCGSKMVGATPAEIKAGVTYPCDDPYCKAIAAKELAA